MKLYVCGQGTKGPGALHPCAKAGKALDKAGYSYETVVLGTYRLMPWTWGSREEDRTEVRELTGNNLVPVLVLDDGKVIGESSAITKWAEENPAPGT